MNRLKISPIFVIVLAIAIVLSANIVQSAKAISHNDPDFVAIQTTLRTYADIKDEALYTLDDSQLSDVLANDPRGGLVDEYFLGLVRYIQGKPDLKIEVIGYLDIYKARYAFQRQVSQLYNHAIATGEVKDEPPIYDPSINPISIDIKGTDKDPATHFRPNPEIVPEILALEKSIGFPAVLPVPTTDKFLPMGFTLLSVSVAEDLAHARVDWDYGLAEDILVKKNGSWYLVGEHILQWHAG